MRLPCSEATWLWKSTKTKTKKGLKKRFPRRSVDIIFAALELRSWHTLMKIAPVSSLIHTCASKLMWDCDCGTPVCLWCTCGWPMVLHKTFWSPKCTEQLSEAGLHEWMPFVSFHSWSHERSNLPLLDQFLSRCWLALCVTMQAEPRIVKQYICHCCCTCKNYRGKVAQDEKKVALHRFSADRKISNLWKKGISGQLIVQAASSCLLSDTHWLQDFKNALKPGTGNIANSLSSPSTAKKVCTISTSSHGT